MNHRLLEALNWAAHMHRLQRRKGKPEPVPGKCPRATPYINHLIAVADLVANVGGESDEDVLVAAVLHDVVEDTLATSKDVQDRFGAHVMGMVMEVTDDKSFEKSKRKALQVEHAPHLSPGAKLVKLADKIHNCEDLIRNPPEWSSERIQEYFEWSRRVVDALGSVNEALEARFHAVYARRHDCLGG